MRNLIEHVEIKGRSLNFDTIKTPNVFMAEDDFECLSPDAIDELEKKFGVVGLICDANFPDDERNTEYLIGVIAHA